MSGQYWWYHLSVDELEKMGRGNWGIKYSLDLLQRRVNQDDPKVSARAKAEIKSAIEDHPFLCQFKYGEKGRNNEIVFDPDAEFPIRLEINPPEFDLAVLGLRVPRRFLGYDHHAEKGFGHLVAKITGTHYICRHPELPRLPSGVYKRKVKHGAFAHVSWENSNSGRYKVHFECRLGEIGWSEAFEEIYQLMQSIMNETSYTGDLTLA